MPYTDYNSNNGNFNANTGDPIYYDDENIAKENEITIISNNSGNNKDTNRQSDKTENRSVLNTFHDFRKGHIEHKLLSTFS